MSSEKSCLYNESCGGCSLRSMEKQVYRAHKEECVRKILSPLALTSEQWQTPIFIEDGTRRRATLAFRCHKGEVLLGFNEKKSSALVGIESCPLLTPRLNNNLQNIRRLLTALCAVNYVIKKGKKQIPARILSGDISLTDTANGLDVVLEFADDPVLEHRLLLSEMLPEMSDIIRISHRRKADSPIETLIEKTRPFIDIAGYHVFVPAGTFLQPSVEGEKELVSLVLKYAAGCEGKIADLFCGVGTFSYPLSRFSGNKILAVDSSRELLDGFRHSVNKNQITNIEIVEKNLFKYPLDSREMSGLKLIVIDPPRAGASAQMKELASLSEAAKPQKIIAVSCNPISFVSDARILLGGGYYLQEVTMVDQFIYSDHSELVALFTKNNCRTIVSSKG